MSEALRNFRLAVEQLGMAIDRGHSPAVIYQAALRVEVTRKLWLREVTANETGNHG